MIPFDRAVVRVRNIVIVACLVAGLLPILRIGFAPEVHAGVVILVTTPVDAIALDDACSLREAIITANTNAPLFGPPVPPGECTHDGTPGLDTVVLQVPGPFVLTIPGPGEQAAATGDLDILEDLTLQGEGQTVDAGTLDRAFEVIGATVLISGTTIQNGYVEGSFGGGIHNDAGQLSLVNSYVTDSAAAANIGVGAVRGGGIYTSGALTLTNSHVARNSLQDTAGATMPGDLLGGGGIYNDGGSLRLESGSTVQFNLIPDFFSPWAGLATNFRGGGIYNALGGRLVITGTSVITENYILDPVGIPVGDCEFAGAGIFNEAGSIMTATASVFAQNGAIDISGSTTCRFLGAGIHNQGQVLLAGSRVEGNNASDNGLGYAGGGGLYNAGGAVATVVQGSGFGGNRAGWDGGGLYNAAGGTVTFIDSAASTNVTDQYGGGLYNAGTMVISQTNVLTNTASLGGGGVENRGSLRVDAVTFSGNVVSSSGGGGLANRDGTVNLTHSQLSDNQANTHGGGIWNNHTLNLSHVTMVGNDAGGQGGGLYSEGIAATANLTHTTLLSNTAYYGGGLYNLTGTVTIGPAEEPGSVSELRGNMAHAQGGGIYNHGTMGITATHILTNTALESGGGVYNTGHATLSGGMVLTNVASIGGGGICNTGTLTLSQTTLAANVAYQAGGIENQGTLLVDQGVIRDNEARESGGGIHNLDGVVSAIRSVIAKNRAAGDGGGIWNNGRLVLDITSLSKNEADADSDGYGRGGGIYNDGVASRVALTDTAVISNTAQDGAGMCNLDGLLTIHAGQVSENVAAGGAGGILNEGIAVLGATTIAANVAASDGGGIFNTNQASLTITGTAIIHNEARGLNGGGGIFNFDSTATLTNSTLAYNWASDTDGGGIWNGTTLALANVTLSGNTAQARGGGLFNNFGSTASLTHTTVAFNEAVLGTGGGLYMKEQVTTTLRNSIVSGNTGENCAGLGNATSAGYNLDSDGTCQLAGTGDLALTDPLLGPLQDNGGPTDTHALLSGSPAVDVIPPDRCPLPVDQRGVTRPQGPACDIGAYEEAWYQIYLPIVFKGP